METYELIIMVAIGLALLLFGYRIKKVAFFIVWFLLGYSLVSQFMPSINGMVPEIEHNAIYQTLLPIAGGVILAMLGFSIEKLCVGGICFVLVMLIAIKYFGTDMATLVIAAIVAVFAAGAAVTLMKPATIVATSAAGAYALTIVLLQIFTLEIGSYYWPVLIGLTTVGSLFQFTTTKHLL